MKSLRALALLLVASTVFLPAASCADAPPRVSAPWTADDLRRLDPAGDAKTPAADILAVYARAAEQDLQIRVDLLDLSFGSEYRLGLLLFEDDGLSPLSLCIEPEEVSPVYDHSASRWSPLRPRVVRDPWLDAVIVSFNRRLLAERIHFAVATFPPGGAPAEFAILLPARWNEAEDHTPRLALDGRPPAALAPALLAFTDAFPAATPAQALRRWDGAHTGPAGERHGLKHILANARAHRIPVALLDLKTPSSLAALDFLGGVEELRQMEANGLLLLPDVAYGEPADVSLDFSRRAADAFGLPRSPFVYAVSGNLAPGARFQFVPLPDPSRLSRAGRTRLIPLPLATAAEPQAAADGPSLATRRALMDAALSSDPADLVVLGGSLPNSPWGDSDVAAAAFAWLAAHPWIHALDADDLKRFPIGAEDRPVSFTPPAAADAFLPALRAAPDNAAVDSAWQTYFMLTAPTSDQNLRALRLHYLGQVGVLTAAGRWAAAPFTQTDCAVDFDRDLQFECILANKSYFAILETDGARLTHLFYGEHQLIGPAAQFAVGLSDPSAWNLLAGDAADPGLLMGAFSDETQTYQPYAVSWPAPGLLALASADGRRVKTFRLTESGLEVTYQADGPVGTRLSLAADPQRFFAAPSDYRAVLSPDAWTWGPAGGIRVRVRTGAKLSAQGFTVSLPFLGLPENPDFDYPAGHYLPFPLSAATIRSEGGFSVQIGLP